MLGQQLEPQFLRGVLVLLLLPPDGLDAALVKQRLELGQLELTLHSRNIGHRDLVTLMNVAHFRRVILVQQVLLG